MMKYGSKPLLVYHGETFLGELENVPVSRNAAKFDFPTNEIRIDYISSASERCHPLSILHTLSPYSVICKLQSPLKPSSDQFNLLHLHTNCFRELKTAVIVLGTHELHLVAMRCKHSNNSSNNNNYGNNNSKSNLPCFWCYSIPSGMYSNCLSMLNLRCLSIVFDLDETLIVANTMKSFDDRIEALKLWISRETDPVRLTHMTSELNRYAHDKALLKQFIDTDTVVAEGGKVCRVHFEEILPVSQHHDRFLRPVIRLPENNIVLTRINPENRDTSVLVRLRPAWEDLRSYLTAKGRKRFEVFVCTMAERDYALEMWRLLDPEAQLISSKQLLNRVVCVKSGSRKSLLHVFQDGICNPNMAMVIDDRVKVWEQKDQPRVHMVPAFTPYYAPQAETASAVPVLCVARNVACNVRGGFFKDFDENLIRKISELFYEDEMSNLPSPPDVSNYLISEESGFIANGNSFRPFSEGISGVEVEQRLPQYVTGVDPDRKFVTNIPDSRSQISQQAIPSVSSAHDSLRMNIPSHKGVLGLPAIRNIKNPSFDPPILKLPAQTSKCGWLAEEEISRVQSRGHPHESDVLKLDKSRAYSSSLGHRTAPAAPSIQPHRGRIEEAAPGCLDLLKHNLPSIEQTGTFEATVCQKPALSLSKQSYSDSVKVNVLPSSLSISVLQEIGQRCCGKVEFKPIISTNKDFRFSVEVLFTDERIGVGMGNSRKDAQQQAAKSALHYLADKFFTYATSSVLEYEEEKVPPQDENGFIWADPQLEEMPCDDKPQREYGSEAADMSHSSTSLIVPSEQFPKHANSPRIQLSPVSKRSRDEMAQGVQNSTSARSNCNGDPPS